MFYGRRLFKAVTFFALGDIIALVCPRPAFYICFICAIAVFGVIALFNIEKYKHLGKFFAFLAFGLILGQIFNNFFISPFRVYEGARTEIVGYVTETDELSGNITLSVKDTKLTPFRFNAKLYGDGDTLSSIKKGDMLSVVVDCGKISEKLYLIADRCYIQGKIVSFSKAEAEIGTFDLFYLNTREVFSEALRNALGDSDEFAVANGILVGDKTAIGTELKDAFKATGTSHFLSISGLHFSLIVMMTYFVVLRICSNDRAASIVSIIVILLYMPITSLTPSVIRAAFISLLVFITRLTNLKSDTVTSMSLSLIFILLFNPAAILSVGLQLSYCATFGIIYSGIVSPQIEMENRHAFLHLRLRRYILSGFKVSTLALVFTTPIVILSFGSFTVFSPLFNIILSPLFTIVLVCTIIIAFASLLFPIFSAYIIWIFKFPLSIFINLIKFFGSFPFVRINTDGKLIIVLSWLLAFAVFIAILTHGKAREKDGKIFLFICWGSVILAALLGL